MSQKLEDYEVIDIVGSGSSSTCYKVRHKFSKKLYVWKAIDYGSISEDRKQLLVSEVNLLCSLNHANIVKYCGRILHKETTTLYIITEWCEGGDLDSLIKNTKKSGKYLEEKFIWKMLYQISRALQVCHSRLGEFTVFHRDVKPANVFLDQCGNAKLGDFGLARMVQAPTDFSTTLVGTPNYMSPELVNGRQYDRKSDIWALGCLVYELCTFIPPFTGSNLLELADMIKRGKYKDIPSHYSNNLTKMISFLLSPNHQYRPTIEMILHHPLVVVNIKSDEEYFKAIKMKKSVLSKNEDNNVAENLSLIEPEQITYDVFKERLVEKQEALREREAWITVREKYVRDMEKLLDKRERELQLLSRRRQHFNERRRELKGKEKIPTKYDGHETDMSAEPSETPIRPTSSKLDPKRFPRPEILANAHKQLSVLNIRNNINEESSSIRTREPTKTVRSIFTENRDSNKFQVLENKPEILHHSTENKRKLERGRTKKMVTFNTESSDLCKQTCLKDTKNNTNIKYGKERDLNNLYRIKLEKSVANQFMDGANKENVLVRQFKKIKITQ